MFWFKKKKTASKKATKAKKAAPKKKAVKKPVVAKAAPVKRAPVLPSSRILTAEGWRRRRLEQLLATARKRRTPIAV